MYYSEGRRPKSQHHYLQAVSGLTLEAEIIAISFNLPLYRPKYHLGSSESPIEPCRRISGPVAAGKRREQPPSLIL